MKRRSVNVVFAVWLLGLLQGGAIAFGAGLLMWSLFYL